MDGSDRADFFADTGGESQSLTRETSLKGQRYIHHIERGSRVLLFVREESKRGGVTLPFLCLGFADYVRHEGDSGGLLPGAGRGGLTGGRLDAYPARRP